MRGLVPERVQAPYPQPIHVMNDTPPDRQRIIDHEHLKLLAIAHYIYGVLQGLISCVLIFHFGLGLLMIIAPHVFGGNHQQAPPAWAGLLMSGFAGLIMFLGWLFAALTIYSGICIKRRQYRIYSLIIAALNCLSFPFGTALGVFTFIVLLRDSVKQLYDASQHRTLRDPVSGSGSSEA